jgi:hypothetical protein
MTFIKVSPSAKLRFASEGETSLVGRGWRRLSSKPDAATGEKRAAAGQHDPFVDDIGDEFGGGVLERHLDGLDDRADRFGQALGI